MDFRCSWPPPGWVLTAVLRQPALRFGCIENKEPEGREGEGLVQGHRGCQEQEQDGSPQGPTPLPPLTSTLTLSCCWFPPWLGEGALLLKTISAIVTKQADDAELETVICFNNNNSNNNLTFIEHLFYARLHANWFMCIRR